MSALAGYRPFDDVHQHASTLATPVVYGASAQGRPLVAYARGTEGPWLCVTAGMHGLEYIGVEAALRALADGPPSGARLLVCPVVNPDGYARTWHEGGDAPVATLRKNARGVDLNRNFPLPAGARPLRLPFAGSDRPSAATYRGPRPLSEPESDALASLLAERRPRAAIGFHSFMGTLITAHVRDRASWRGYATLCRAFQASQAGARYRRLASPVFDVFTGELDDWLHHELGCWAITVECFSVRESLAQHLRAPTAFQRFNPASPATIAARDAMAAGAALRAALSLGPTPGPRILQIAAARSGLDARASRPPPC